MKEAASEILHSMFAEFNWLMRWCGHEDVLYNVLYVSMYFKVSYLEVEKGKNLWFILIWYISR